jgi:hypothetical protein
MNFFQKKYNIKENSSTINFHENRRMFCIYNNELVIAEPNVPYSHAEWFEAKGWMSKEDDSLMDEIVRGYVDTEGNIYFYKGYDFRIDSETEQIFFRYLDELLNKFELKKEKCKVFGGMKRKEGKWTSRKEYRGIF